MAAQGGRRRGAASGGRRAQRSRHRGDRRPLRGADPGARGAAGADRPLLRRPDRRALARPRTRTRGRGAQPRAAQGNPRAALLVAQGRGACARASVQVARDRDADARGVHLRVREHVLSRGGRRRIRALRGPGDGPDLLRGWASPTSTSTPRPRCTSRTPSARRCSSWARGRTRRCRPRSPASSTRSTSARRRKTEYLEFEGRPHLLMAAEGWDEVAAAIDSWLDGVLEAQAPPAPGASA